MPTFPLVVKLPLASTQAVVPGGPGSPWSPFGPSSPFSPLSPSSPFGPWQSSASNLPSPLMSSLGSPVPLPFRSQQSRPSAPPVPVAEITKLSPCLSIVTLFPAISITSSRSPLRLRTTVSFPILESVTELSAIVLA